MKIVCNNISKNFISGNSNLCVLENITAETTDHDFICILGPNGCGKTTLLRIMAGIIKPSGGSISYVDDNSNSAPASLIFQEQGLFPWLNVIDNICFNLEMKGLSKKERYGKAQGFIKEMRLTRFIDYYPYQLSTGMKQKVGLIRGLLTNSKVLLIDEPGASLDIYTKFIIHKDIYKIWDKYHKTIIYVTQDIEEALFIAQQIWIMSRSPAKIIRKFDIASYKSTKQNIDSELAEIKNQIFDIIKKEYEKD